MKSESNMKKTAESLGGSNFLVSIHYQENQSWQGVIQWLDTGAKAHFRSVFEMLSLIDKAILSDSGAEPSHRNWEEFKSYDVG